MSETFHCLVVKISVYLNRLVYVMSQDSDFAAQSAHMQTGRVSKSYMYMHLLKNERYVHIFIE